MSACERNPDPAGRPAGAPAVQARRCDPCHTSGSELFVRRQHPVYVNTMKVELTTEMAEAAEADFMHAYEAGAPAAVRERLGSATRRIGGGVVLSMLNDPMSYWSRTLGFTEPVTRELVAQIVAFYRDKGCGQARIQIAPSALPANWEEIRAAHGIEPMHQGLKLAAPIGQVRPR